MKTKNGNILLFSLMIMGVITFVTQQLVKSVTIGTAFSRAMVDHEQAELLAISGINVATAQLARSMQPEKKEQVEPTGGPVFSFKNFIEQIAPHLERWQTFELSRDIEGCDGEIKISISCEEGKIPLNAILDEPHRIIKEEPKQLLKGLSLKKKIAVGQMPTKLTMFFNQRDEQVADITELDKLARDLKLPLFYAPPIPIVKKKDEKADIGRDIAVQNMFTLWREETVINPLLLSDALCATLRIRRPQAGDATRRADRYKRLAEIYNQVKNTKDDEMWKHFQILFETKPRLAKELTGFFSPVVEPRFFSVVSCGKVGDVSQKVLAIIERVEEKEPAEEQKQAARKQNEKQKSAISYFQLRRLYWI